MMQIAEKHEVQSLIEDLHARYQSLTDGRVATYISMSTSGSARFW